MKVKVKELKANPFRDLENYPFNMEKIEKLKKSIEQTGFWDNILARQVNGQIQIAYGHHRLKALQEVYSPDYMVEVPIKDLSDELMLKIMANENMEEWQSSVAVIDETVRAVRGFLSRETQISANQIANFLSWPLTRVSESLVRINAIENSGIDKQAVETLPTAKAATAFVAAAKGLTPEQQRKVADKIKASEDYSYSGVKDKVLIEKYPKQEKQLTLDSKIKDTISAIKKLDKSLSELIKLRNELDEEVVIRQFTAVEFQPYLNNIVKTIKNLLA